MDRPSYHVDPQSQIMFAPGSTSHMFDLETARPYRYKPDKDNPEMMAFHHSEEWTGAAGAVSFQVYDDFTPLNESSGTQMARVEVEASWDISEHYDLSVKPGGGLEFVYETPAKVPFQVLTKGILRGTAIARIHTANVTIVSLLYLYLFLRYTI